MLCAKFAKGYSFINLFDILPKNIVVMPSIRPDIRYPAGYPAKQYPVHPYVISIAVGYGIGKFL
jgi:hypothetical protein